MSQYTVTRDYSYPRDEVWHVVTEPEYVAKWTTTGQGGRPEDFVPVAGQKFRLVGKPTIGWAGVVYCEVLEVFAPHSLRYSWKGDKDTDSVSIVDYTLAEIDGGTRFTIQHTGFTGVGGFLMSRLLGRVRRRMLTQGVPPVLAAYHASAR